MLCGVGLVAPPREATNTLNRRVLINPADRLAAPV